MKKIQKALQVVNSMVSDSVYLENDSKYTGWIDECYDDSNDIGLHFSLQNLTTNIISRYIVKNIRNEEIEGNLLLRISYLSHKTIMLSTALTIYDDDRSGIIASELSKFFAMQILAKDTEKMQESFNSISYKINTRTVYIFDQYRSLYFLYSLYSKFSTGSYDRKIINLFPKMSNIYDQAIESFDTTNMDDLGNILIKLCDEHIEQSYFDGEYEYETLWVYPYEILALLSLRQMAGLEIPAKINHPLFELQWNKPPNVEKLGKFTDKKIDKAYISILKRVEEYQNKNN